MFERFTDRARRVVVFAQEESRGLGHNYIGTEHLLLGLTRETEGVAAKTLTALDLETDGLRDEVVATIGRGVEPPKGHIPFTPRAKKVLELALRIALRLQHGYIGTEHLLLALLEEGEGVAARVLLKALDGDLKRIEDEILSQLAGDVTPDRLQAVMAEIQERFKRSPTFGARGEGDDIGARLEAIEARLTTIERLLREQRGEETG